MEAPDRREEPRRVWDTLAGASPGVVRDEDFALFERVDMFLLVYLRVLKLDG